MDLPVGDTKRVQASNKHFHDLCKRRGKPEVHIHTAVTLVWSGDPMAITQADRDQAEIEAGQWAARMKYGQIGVADIIKAMKEMTEQVMKRMRGSGSMRSGQ